MRRSVSAPLLAALALGLAAAPADGQSIPFERDPTASAVVADVYFSSVALGDLDGDGDLDLVLTGVGADGTDRRGEVYLNDGTGRLGRHASASAIIADVWSGSVALGDLDGDGDLDLVLTGFDSSNGPRGEVYVGLGDGRFTRDAAASAALADVGDSSVALGDLDGDGDLDLVLTGYDRTDRRGEVYVNDGDGGLAHDVDASADIAGVSASSVALGDLDGDGDLDLVLTGSVSGGRRGEVYLNDGAGGLARDADASNDISDVATGSIALGDLDGDGDLDLVLTGQDAGGHRGEVYVNDGGGGFARDATTDAEIHDVFFSSVALGDLDGDGDLDLVLTGQDAGGHRGEVYVNDGGGGLAHDPGASAVVADASISSIALGDLDDDGDLDLVLTGSVAGGGRGEVYVNGAAPPSPPTADLVVDTAADDQPYDAAASLAACTDAFRDGDCTLREAIEVANAEPGLDLVGFDILAAHGADAGGRATLAPASDLPALLDAGITIDGTTQPGAARNTLADGSDAVIQVALDGGGTRLTGLLLAGPDQTVRGLAVGGFTFAGISASLSGSVAHVATDAVIEGNVIGTDGDGTTANPNALGVYVAVATGVRVGTDGDGTDDPAERNVISGNGYGVFIQDSRTAGTVVAGNHIGTDPPGTGALPNTASGVYIEDAADVRIGTDGDGAHDAAEANRVAFNGSAGVEAVSAPGATILGNAIADNGGLGIDVAGTGVTANDTPDADGWQNRPTLAAEPLIDASGAGTVDAALASTPSTAFRVEVFASTAADGSGSGEGARLVGTATLTTDGAGAASGPVAVAGVAEGEALTATATAVDGASPTGFGGTSEFSGAAVASRAVRSVLLDGAAGWRMLASPEATTVGAFLGAFWTQGFIGADHPAGECTVYTFSEAAATFAEGWTCVGDAADPLGAGEGLMVYLFDDDDPVADGPQNPFPKTLSTPSRVVPGAFAFTVPYTDGGRLSGQRGWSLLGVPGGAALSWPALARTAVSGTAYVYDPAVGDYLTITVDGGAVFGDLPDGAIPPFQGFFARALAPTAALSADADAYDAGRDVVGRQAAPAVVRLSLADADGERSVAWLALADGAEAGPDDRDAPRLAPTAWPRAVVYSTPLGDATPLVANAVPADLGGASALDVPLGLDLSGHAGPVVLTLAATADGLPDGWALALVDHATGAVHDLGAGPAAFTAEPAAAGRVRPAQFARPAQLAASAPRFALRIATDGHATAAAAEASAGAALLPLPPNPAADRATVAWRLAAPGEARVTVVDLLGRTVAEVHAGPVGAGLHHAALDTARLAAGVYVVRLLAGGTVHATRLTVVR